MSCTSIYLPSVNRTSSVSRFFVFYHTQVNIWLNSHSHSIGFVLWNSHSTNAKFSWLCHIPIHKHVQFCLTLSSPVVSNGYTSKCSEPYWSNPPFLIFWHSGTLALSQERRHYNALPCAISHIFAYWTSLTVMYIIFFTIECGIAAFSALCMYSKLAHRPHPLGFLCAKFCFFRHLHCWASPWRTIAYSITHSPSLFDAPGTEDFALELFGLRARQQENLPNVTMQWHCGREWNLHQC